LLAESAHYLANYIITGIIIIMKYVFDNVLYVKLTWFQWTQAYCLDVPYNEKLHA